MTGVFDSGLLRRGYHANGRDTNSENIRLWPVCLSRTFGEVPGAEKAQDSNHIWNHRNLYGSIDPSGQSSYFRIDIESGDTGQSDAQVLYEHPGDRRSDAGGHCRTICGSGLLQEYSCLLSGDM